MFSYVTSAPCLFFRRIQNSVSQNLFVCLIDFIVGVTRTVLVSLLVSSSSLLH